MGNQTTGCGPYATRREKVSAASDQVKRFYGKRVKMNWTADKQTGDLTAAIAYFNKQLPGWWFSVGACHVSADATCAPDTAGCDAGLFNAPDRETVKFFDSGFDVDLHPPATMADALIQVTDIARLARDAYYKRNNLEDAKDALASLGIAA